MILIRLFADGVYCLRKCVQIIQFWSMNFALANYKINCFSNYQLVRAGLHGIFIVIIMLVDYMMKAFRLYTFKINSSVGNKIVRMR